MILAAMSFRQPMASMVTTAPLRSSIASKSGMAVISLDLASVATCPKVKWFTTAQAAHDMQGRAADGFAPAAAALGLTVDGDRRQLGRQSVATGVNPVGSISAVIQEEKPF